MRPRVGTVLIRTSLFLVEQPGLLFSLQSPHAGLLRVCVIRLRQWIKPLDCCGFWCVIVRSIQVGIGPDDVSARSDADKEAIDNSPPRR